MERCEVWRNVRRISNKINILYYIPMYLEPTYCVLSFCVRYCRSKSCGVYFIALRNSDNFLQTPAGKSQTLSTVFSRVVATLGRLYSDNTKHKLLLAQRKVTNAKTSLVTLFPINK